MSRTSIIASYLLETPLPPDQAAEMIAGEQSSGTFISVPGETEELKARARARVVDIQPLDDAPLPSLPGSRSLKPLSSAPRYRRCKIRVAFPFDNIGPNLPTLLATISGNLVELREVSGLKLLDVDLPDAFTEGHPGPQFGVDGTRQLTSRSTASAINSGNPTIRSSVP